jgi:hypothetical protein
VSFGNQTVQELMAGRAILQASFLREEPADKLQQDPTSAATWLELADLVATTKFQVANIADINLKDMTCVGCTGTAGPLALMTVPIMTVAAKPWNLGDVNIIGLNWPGSATPTNITGKKSTFEICRGVLIARRGLLTLEQFSALERQLKSLLVEDEDSLEAIEIAASSTSFDGLIEFLARHRPDAHPNIALTREGRFTASWLGGKRAKITLIFDREGGDWVAVDLDSRPPVRARGAFVVNSLAGIAQPFRAWIKA